MRTLDDVRDTACAQAVTSERAVQGRIRHRGVLPAVSVAVCVWVLAFNAVAGTLPGEFRFWRSLTPPDALKHEIASVSLDERVFSETTPRYADLRIFSSDNVEIPVLVRPRTLRLEVVIRSDVSAERIDVALSEDNKIVVTLRKKKPEDVPAIFKIESAKKNFEKQVSIKGSHDKQSRETLVQGEPVFDYSRYMDVRKDEVRIPSGPYTY